MRKVPQQTLEPYDLIIIGGGAAGFFTAILAAEKVPELRILILEKQSKPLQKVRISGGGRCNVSHHCFDANKLIDNYPRGKEKLLAPFQRFGPRETIRWFEEKGVKLKTENDGRIFPVSDDSQTIIDCFQYLIKKNRIKIEYQVEVSNLIPEKQGWKLWSSRSQSYRTKKLCITAGSNKKMWGILENLGFKTISPVPSLFTFKIDEKSLHILAGTSFKVARSKYGDLAIQAPGIITHWGLSGPAILKLSSIKARDFAACGYKFQLLMDWLPEYSENTLVECFRDFQVSNTKKKIRNTIPFGLSQRFWSYICDRAMVGPFQNWSESGKKLWKKLLVELKHSEFKVTGKSTFKEEFVTAGGIDLTEINFESFSTLKYPNLYMAGEILNIDAVTGGFNFQAAWTGAWHIAKGLGETSENV